MRIQKLGTLGLMLLSVAFMGGCEKPTTTTPGGEATPTPQADQVSTTTTTTASPTPSTTPADEIDLTVLNWGPKSTQAGVPFNSQGDNKSYMFFSVKKLSPDVVIIFKGQELPERAINLKTNSTSATVPEELYKEPGDAEIYLMDKATGKKSETLIFKVEAKTEAAGQQTPEAAAQQTTQTQAAEQPAQANANEQQAPAAAKKANGKKKTKKKSADD